MKQFAFPLGDKPALTIRSHADLRMTGWDRPDASVDSEPGYSLKVEQGQTGLRITCLDDCEIFIPVNTLVTIEKVSGDLTIANLSGQLNIEKVGGSAVFTQVGTTTVDHIGGDCDLSGAAGNFVAGKIGGSLDVSQFTGDLLVDKVGGDIQAGGVTGRFISRAGGSIRAQLLDGFGPAVQLRAGGDITLHLPENDRGHYAISCGSEEIKVDLPGMNETIENRFYEFKRGEGVGVEVELRAGGSVELTAQPLAASAPVPPVQTERRERVNGRGWPDISRTTEDAINRAARSAEEALRHAERRVTEALRGLETRPPRTENVITPPAPPVPPVPGAAEFVPAADSTPVTTEPEVQLDDAAVVSDQERLLILKMLQEKKITVEEAEALFEALGNPG